MTGVGSRVAFQNTRAAIGILLFCLTVVSVASLQPAFAEIQVVAPRDMTGNRKAKVFQTRYLGRARTLLRCIPENANRSRCTWREIRDQYQADRQWLRDTFGRNWRRELRYDFEVVGYSPGDLPTFPQINGRWGILFWRNMPGGTFEIIVRLTTRSGEIVTRNGQPIQDSFLVEVAGVDPRIDTCDQSYVSKFLFDESGQPILDSEGVQRRNGSGVWGDVNGDGITTAVDLNLLLKAQADALDDTTRDTNLFLNATELKQPRPGLDGSGFLAPFLDVPDSENGQGDCKSDEKDRENLLNILNGGNGGRFTADAVRDLVDMYPEDVEEQAAAFTSLVSVEALYSGKLDLLKDSTALGDGSAVADLSIDPETLSVRLLKRASDGTLFCERNGLTADNSDPEDGDAEDAFMLEALANPGVQDPEANLEEIDPEDPCKSVDVQSGIEALMAGPQEPDVNPSPASTAGSASSPTPSPSSSPTPTPTPSPTTIATPIPSPATAGTTSTPTSTGYYGYP